MAYKKRGVQLVFTHLEGFAIPVTSRKTTDVHARYAIPPTHNLGVDGIYYISTRTFIVVARTSYEMLRRFQDVANNVNKRLFYVTALLSLSVPALRLTSVSDELFQKMYTNMITIQLTFENLCRVRVHATPFG